METLANLTDEADRPNFQHALKSILRLRGDVQNQGEVSKLLSLMGFNKKTAEKTSKSRTNNKRVTNLFVVIFKVSSQQNSMLFQPTLTSKDKKSVQILRTLGLMEHAKLRSSSEYDLSENTGGPPIRNAFETNNDSTPHDSEPAAYKWKHDPSSDLIVIRITDIQARHLVTKAVFGYANPYVVFTLDGERLKTGVKWNTGEPSWTNEEIRFRRSTSGDSDRMLHVRVYDKERIARKTLIGAVSINISVVDLHPISSWFALEGGVVGCSGEIHLAIEQFMY
jgi:hypothetical protein